MNMEEYECPCGYIYEPNAGDMENGIDPGTPFEDLPEEWVCPICGLEKKFFYRHKIQCGKRDDHFGRLFMLLVKIEK